MADGQLSAMMRLAMCGVDSLDIVGSIINMGDDIRLGVIGTGIGATHIDTFSQISGAEVIGVASADRRRAERLATTYGLSFATDDYRRLLTANIDAVVIAAPPAFHQAMVVDAVAAGKHIFCEKPLSVSISESQTMLDAVEHAELVHMMNFHLRFAPEFMTVANIVQAGLIGSIANVDAAVRVNPIDYLNASWGSPNKTAWFTNSTQGGGLLRSSAGPHLADFLFWLGGNIESVVATTMTSQPQVRVSAIGQFVDVPVDDGFAIIARFANGAIATMRGLPVAEHETEFSLSINGEHGSLYVSGGELHGMLKGENQIHRIPLECRRHDARQGIATAFIEAIRSRDLACHPNFGDGMMVQALLAACTRSAELNSWVQLDQNQRPRPQAV